LSSLRSEEPGAGVGPSEEDITERMQGGKEGKDSRGREEAVSLQRADSLVRDGAQGLWRSDGGVGGTHRSPHVLLPPTTGAPNGADWGRMGSVLGGREPGRQLPCDDARTSGGKTTRNTNSQKGFAKPPGVRSIRVPDQNV
jgi:hypothetical protein